MAEPNESSPEKTSSERLRSMSRNDPCFCGSKKKYKRCHLPADEGEERARLAQLQKQAELARVAEAEAEAEAAGRAESGSAKKKTAGRVAAGKSPRTAPATGKGQGTLSRPNNMPRRKAI